MIFIQKEIRSFSPVCFYTVTQDDKNQKREILKRLQSYSQRDPRCREILNGEDRQERWKFRLSSFL